MSRLWRTNTRTHEQWKLEQYSVWAESAIIYQDASFKICLSLFGWKVNILYKMHIVHCTGFPTCLKSSSFEQKEASFSLKKCTFSLKLSPPDEILKYTQNFISCTYNQQLHLTKNMHIFMDMMIYGCIIHAQSLLYSISRMKIVRSHAQVNHRHTWYLSILVHHSTI